MSVKRLTPHQREVWKRLCKYASNDNARGGDGWVSAKDIGSRGALDHLVAKGYAERKEDIGPRGGSHYFYRQTGANWDWQG